MIGCNDEKTIGRLQVFFRAARMSTISFDNGDRVTRLDRCYDHNFLHFFQFSAKNGVFLKNQCYDQIFKQFSFVLSQKRRFFCKSFRLKYLKNHNIGPRLGEFSPLGQLLILGSCLIITEVAHTLEKLFSTVTVY
jgi:hypothetical protein